MLRAEIHDSTTVGDQKTVVLIFVLAVASMAILAWTLLKIKRTVLHVTQCARLSRCRTKNFLEGLHVYCLPSWDFFAWYYSIAQLTFGNRRQNVTGTIAKLPRDMYERVAIHRVSRIRSTKRSWGGISMELFSKLKCHLLLVFLCRVLYFLHRYYFKVILWSSIISLLRPLAL